MQYNALLEAYTHELKKVNINCFGKKYNIPIEIIPDNDYIKEQEKLKNNFNKNKDEYCDNINKSALLFVKHNKSKYNLPDINDYSELQKVFTPEKIIISDHGNMYIKLKCSWDKNRGFQICLDEYR